MTSIVPLTREKRKYAQAIQAMVASAFGPEIVGDLYPSRRVQLRGGREMVWQRSNR